MSVTTNDLGTKTCIKCLTTFSSEMFYEHSNSCKICYRKNVAINYRKKHPKILRQKHDDGLTRCQRYRKNHRERNNENSQRWRKRHPEETRTRGRAYAKNRRVRLRQQVIELLGGHCNNPNCPIPKDKMNPRCLQVDHINGGGRKEQKKFNGQHATYIIYLINDIKQHPEKYQLLCAYCNWEKRMTSPKERACKSD